MLPVSVQCCACFCTVLCLFLYSVVPVSVQCCACFCTVLCLFLYSVVPVSVQCCAFSDKCLLQCDADHEPDEACLKCVCGNGSEEPDCGTCLTVITKV